MYARTIKKTIGLFIVYTVLIIGIFKLQFSDDFSNDSIITEKIGNLQITLLGSKDADKKYILKNELQINFNGITFSCDDTKPAFIMRTDSEEKESIELLTYEKVDDLSFEFVFTEDVTFKIALSDESETAGLSFVAVFPDGVEGFYLPYSFMAHAETERKSQTKLLVEMKKGKWEFVTPYFDEEYLYLSSTMDNAMYSHYVEAVEFRFDALTQNVVDNDYTAAVREFRNNVISSFKANTAEALGNEKAVVAYVAEQAQRGNYTSAVDEIPQSFKRSSSRTYLSAPYFNSLSEMDNSLEIELKEKENLIKKTAEKHSLDLLTIRGITNHLYIYPNSLTTKSILMTSGSSNVQNCSIAECAALLRVYVEMNALSQAFARHLVPTLSDCVLKIENACKIENGNLTISENDTFLSVVQAVEVGDALMLYGQYIKDDTIAAGGKALIASYLGDAAAFDIKLLGDLYPVVVRDNAFYPHFIKIVTLNDDVIWAWTIANDISYSASGKTVSYTIDFPANLTHYAIIRGIPSFRSIYIYDTAFRSDSRFESYNSSGYTYKSNTKALLLKSRHRVKNEVVRLEY